MARFVKLTNAGRRAMIAQCPNLPWEGLGRVVAGRKVGYKSLAFIPCNPRTGEVLPGLSQKDGDTCKLFVQQEVGEGENARLMNMYESVQEMAFQVIEEPHATGEADAFEPPADLEVPAMEDEASEGSEG